MPKKNLLEATDTTTEKKETIQKLFAKIMTTLWLDLKDPLLQETPRRVAKMSATDNFTFYLYRWIYWEKWSDYKLK